MITNPSNIFFALGIPLTGLAVLLFSVDRLIAVLYPIRYYQFSAAYATKLNIGSVTIAICIPTVLVILLKKNLRNQKEYIIIVGAILMESVYNVGFLVRSSIYLMRHRRVVPVALSRWTCMITNPSNIFFALGIPLTGLAVLLFSVDRLIAVLYPTRYYQFMFAMPATALLIIALLSSYLAKDEILIGTDCTFAFAVTNVPWILIRWSRIAFVALAIAIYIPITAVLSAQRNRFISIIGHNKTSLMMRRTMATIGNIVISDNSI
ncbi:unnamed protein product [Toxocara canis]|uniref:G protein-coupled receptor n=1 Tax=Toxocara canis TaxID=6265 RepID=A0A183UYY2_TOXCA|nr:unnamed protein product [Toxocara canis]